MSTSIQFGRSRITFTKNATRIALKESEARGIREVPSLAALAARVPARIRERVGGFHVVDVDASEELVAAETSRIAAETPAERPLAVYHTSDDDVPFVPDGRLHMAFREGVGEAEIAALLERHGLRPAAGVHRDFRTVDVSHQERDAVEIAEELQAEDVVAIAEPELVTPRQLLSFLPTDELLTRQWHLRNVGEWDGFSLGLTAGADARVIDAWERLGNLGDPGVVLAVIDDGFDTAHPDLAGKAIDPFDFIRNNSDVEPEADPLNPSLGDWHGTGCAGVAIARAGGGKVVGAAPNAQFMPIRMADHLTAEQMVKWFGYAVDKGAWIISCSWNARAKVYDLPAPVYRAIEAAATEGRGGAGCVVVFAAGNSGKDVNDPPNTLNGFAIHPDVLAVGASTSLDTWANYSDTGDSIAVCAPSGGRGGLGVATTDVTGSYTDALGEQRHRGYADGAYNTDFKGTSSACPLVAGVCALVLSANAELTASDVREVIRQTARRIGTESDYQDGHSKKYGYGCVDADKAVAKALELKSDASMLAALRAAAAGRRVT